MSSIDKTTGEDKWRGDLKLQVLILIALALFLAVMVIDATVFRPREVFSDKDVQLLEQELERVMGSTSSFGLWQHKMTFVKRHSGFVSAKFSSGGRPQSVSLMVKVLNENGWRLNSLNLEEADASLCKGKYRVYLIWMGSQNLLSVHFAVKEFKKEPDC